MDLPDLREARRRTLGSAVAGIAAILVLYGYFYFGVLGGLHYLDGRESDASLLHFTGGLLLWAGASMTMLVALGAAGIAGFVTLREAMPFLDNLSRRWLGAALWAGLGCAVALSLALHGRGVASLVVTNLRATAKDVLDRPGPLHLSIEQGIVVSATLANLGAGVAIVTLTLAVAAIALDVRRSADAARLQRWASRYQMLLWSASIFLVLVVVQLHFLFDWAAGLPADDATVAALRRLARAVPVAAGFAFSALVAGIFLPLAVIQERRLDELSAAASAEATAAGRPFRRDEWLGALGLGGRSPLGMLASQAAVLLPLAGGLVTQFLQSSPK